MVLHRLYHRSYHMWAINCLKKTNYFWTMVYVVIQYLHYSKCILDTEYIMIILTRKHT